MARVSFYLDIARVDRGNRCVEGYFTPDTKDLQGRAIDDDTLRACLPDFSGASLSEMGAAVPAEGLMAAKITERGVLVRAHVADPQAWAKCNQGVYRGLTVDADASKSADGKVHVSRILNACLVDRPGGASDITRVYMGPPAEAGLSPADMIKHIHAAGVQRSAPSRAELDTLTRSQRNDSPPGKKVTASQKEVDAFVRIRRAGVASRKAEASQSPTDVTRVAVGEIHRRGPQPLKFK